jgi:hypothetical protein
MAMKTDHFENILRKKLESISPQYQEEDWQKMQQYMQRKKPVSSSVTYGSLVQYAVAACLVGGFLFLYISQIQQNKGLKEDLANLHSQIEMLNLSQTNYITKTEDDYTDLLSHKSLASPTTSYEINLKPALLQKGKEGYSAPKVIIKHEDLQPEIPMLASNSILQNQSIISVRYSERDHTPLTLIPPQTQGADLTIIRHFQEDLNNRLSHSEIRKNWPLLTGNSQKINALAQLESQAQSEKGLIQNGQNVFYRLGVGYQNDKLGSGKSIQGQILLGKKLSFATGISWLKVKPLEFISEKIFRDKTSRDFKQLHNNEIPKSSAIANINISPSMVQIPLTVAFRENMSNDWAYTVGAGTNLNIHNKEKISFDSLIPTDKMTLVRDDFERKIDVPLVNSIEISTGLEKAWHPLVLNAEARLYHYFKPLNPVSPRTGPGINLRLSYQLGRAL